VLSNTFGSLSIACFLAIILSLNFGSSSQVPLAPDPPELPPPNPPNLEVLPPVLASAKLP